MCIYMYIYIYVYTHVYMHSHTVILHITRPLEGSCRMELLKFDHPQGQDPVSLSLSGLYLSL